MSKFNLILQQFDKIKKGIPLYFELSFWTLFEPNRPQCVPENLTLIPIQYCRNANTTADDDYGDEVTKNSISLFGCLSRLLKFSAVDKGERPLMTFDIRVGRGFKIAPKIRRYRVGRGR